MVRQDRHGVCEGRGHRGDLALLVDQIKQPLLGGVRGRWEEWVCVDVSGGVGRRRTLVVALLSEQ